MRARTLLAFVPLLGCATLSRPMGEIIVAVESPVPIDRIEFADPDTGDPFHVSAVPAGSSLFKEALRVGRYCLLRYVVGEGAYGKSYEYRSELCVEVTERAQAYAGHFVFSDDGQLGIRADRQCLANQLGEQSSLGNTSVTPCSAQ